MFQWRKLSGTSNLRQISRVCDHPGQIIDFALDFKSLDLHMRVSFLAREIPNKTFVQAKINSVREVLRFCYFCVVSLFKTPPFSQTGRFSDTSPEQSSKKPLSLDLGFLTTLQASLNTFMTVLKLLKKFQTSKNFMILPLILGERFFLLTFENFV